MTDREAVLALTAPEPDIWEGATLDCAAWDAWNAARIEAINHANELRRT